MATELEITELRLGIPGEKKRVFSEIDNDRSSSNVNDDDDVKCHNKNQVVGWPPVCAYRRKNYSFNNICEGSKMYVKVSLDGVPFLRKVDLGTQKDYSEFVMNLEKLFGCYGICKFCCFFGLLNYAMQNCKTKTLLIYFNRIMKFIMSLKRH